MSENVIFMMTCEILTLAWKSVTKLAKDEIEAFNHKSVQ